MVLIRGQDINCIITSCLLDEDSFNIIYLNIIFIPPSNIEARGYKLLTGLTPQCSGDNKICYVHILLSLCRCHLQNHPYELRIWAVRQALFQKFCSHNLNISINSSSHPDVTVNVTVKR